MENIYTNELRKLVAEFPNRSAWKKGVKEYANELLNNLEEKSQLNGRLPKDEKELKKIEEAIVFRNIANMPARVKCALLAWHTIEDMINKGEKEGKINSSCCN